MLTEQQLYWLKWQRRAYIRRPRGGASLPVISNIVVTVSGSDVTITWDTPVNSDSMVEYGLTAAYGTSQGALSDSVTHHSITIYGLAGKIYHFRVSSQLAGAATIYSDDQVFNFAPGLTAASVGTINSDGFTGANVTTDVPTGTLYWAVVTNGGACTAAQIIAGSGGNIVAGKAGNQAVSTTGAQTIATITGLATGASYQIKFLQRPAAGPDSNQASASKTAAVNFAGGSGDVLWTADSVANSVGITSVNDWEARFKATLTDWTPAAVQSIFGKYDTGTNQRSYRAEITAAGLIATGLSSNGTAQTSIATSSLAPTVADGAPINIKIEQKMDNGGGASKTTYYTSPDYDPDLNTGTWTQLGTPITPGITTCLDATCRLALGALGDAGLAQRLIGKIHRFQLFNGIGGSKVADMNPAEWASGSTWVSSTGETWTLAGTTTVTVP